jgi:Rod binding domain-containing protein
MELTSLHCHVKAGDLPVERLAGNKLLSEADKIKEVSHQFEAVLLRQILAAAQKTVISSKTNPESAATGIYRDMITNQLAETISHSGALGLGDTLAHELTHQLKVDPAPKPLSEPG